MRLICAKNYQDMSRKAANLISAQVILCPESVLGLATGSTPIGIYRQLISWYEKGDVDFSKAVSINLDEYCGLSPRDPQSYSCFMHQNFFDHINIDPRRVYLPDGMQTNSTLGMTASSRTTVASTCSFWASAATPTLGLTSRMITSPKALIRSP